MLTHIKLLLTALFWGGTFIAGRVIARDLNAYDAAFLRFTLAVIFLAIVIAIAEKKIIDVKARSIVPLILLGLTGIFAYNIFFFKGLYYIQAGRAALIIATNPIFISLMSAIFFKERLDMFKIFGIVLSVTGAIIVISNGHIKEIFQGHFGRGEFFISLCVVCWVTYSLIGKLVMKDLSPLGSVFYSSLIGTLLLLGPALSHGLKQNFITISFSAWIGLIYLAFFGTVLGFLWYYQGIKALGATRAGLYINFVPISAILLGFFLLDEPFTLSLLIGALLVTAGVYMTNIKMPFKKRR
jgi:drug/metabolite transporter (DMT)-like permease